MYASLLLLQAGAANAIIPQVVMWAAIVAIFYFVLYRPQATQRKKHEEMIRTLKRGDEIVTAGGVVGEVVLVKEQTAGTPSPEDLLTIRSGESRLVVQRGRVVAVAPRGAASAAAQS